MSRHNDLDLQQARLQGRTWARQLLARDNWVLLDTETTGLDSMAEVVELAVLAPSGTVLIDTLLRPATSIPLAASAIHGLTDATVLDAPTAVELWPDLLPLLTSKHLVAYHVAFDVRVLRQTAARYGLPFPLQPRAACAMEAYALFCGQRSPASGRPVRHTLSAACAQLGIVAEGTFHRAVDDCRATLALLQAMATWQPHDGDDPNPRRAPDAPARLRASVVPLPVSPRGVPTAAASGADRRGGIQPRPQQPENVTEHQRAGGAADPAPRLVSASRQSGHRPSREPPLPRISGLPATTPHAPSTPAAPGVPLQTVRAAWSEVRSRCKRQSLRVAALLASAHPHAIEAGNPPVLVLQADYPFHYQQLCDPQHLAIVVAALHAVLRETWRVRVTLAPQVQSGIAAQRAPTTRGGR